jgi:hypothetical protein
MGSAALTGPNWPNYTIIHLMYYIHEKFRRTEELYSLCEFGACEHLRDPRSSSQWSCILLKPEDLIDRFRVKAYQRRSFFDYYETTGSIHCLFLINVGKERLQFDGTVWNCI